MAMALTGRGGAGNISKPASALNANDLSTPHIKSATYTTGRGGQGNMAQNDPTRPEMARAAQDVEGPAPEPRDGIFHWGRGGEGNMMAVRARAAAAANRSSSRPGQPLSREGSQEGSRRSGEREKTATPSPPPQQQPRSGSGERRGLARVESGERRGLARVASGEGVRRSSFKEGVRRSSFKEVVNRSKEMLGLGSAKGRPTGASDNAIED